MLLQFHLLYFLSTQKLHELQQSSFIKKKTLLYTLKKSNVFMEIITQTNSSYSDIY